MRALRVSEIARLQRQIEQLQLRNQTVEQRLGYRPTPRQYAEAYLGGRLDTWQRAYLDDAMVSARVAIAACRQSGKSTVTALFIAWCMLFQPGFQCLVASRSLRQAGHFISLVRNAVLAMIPRDSIAMLNRLSIELPNRSSIISIPCAQPDAGRGFSPHMVLLDEAAFAPQGLFTAITPSIAATGGALHMISSPNGRQGYFYEAFEGSAAAVYRTQRVTWEMCPRIERSFIEEERVAMGDLGFRQEYMAEFVTPEGAFFGALALDSIGVEEDEPIDALSLRDMEKWLEDKDPLKAPTPDDLRAALDRTQRVSQVLHV